MTIKQINSGNYSEKDLKKSGSSQSVKKGDVSSASNNRDAGKVSPGDQLSLSGSQPRNEVDFAKNILNKLGSDSFSALRKVRQKIENGEYNNENVHQKISTLVEKDISSLEHLVSSASQAEEHTSSQKTLSPEYKKYLIENPKVVKQVSDGIAKDIRKI